MQLTNGQEMTANRAKIILLLVQWRRPWGSLFQVKIGQNSVLQRNNTFTVNRTTHMQSELSTNLHTHPRRKQKQREGSLRVCNAHTTQHSHSVGQQTLLLGSAVAVATARARNPTFGGRCRPFSARGCAGDR